jgi:O-antigen/teichoic acid export membrane protein
MGNEESVSEKSISAILWGGAGTIARIVLQLGAQITLARLLGPTEFGLFAVGALIVSFSNFFADIGIAYSLIQQPEVTDRDIRFVFTWQLLIGSAVTAVIFSASGLLAHALGQPDASSVIQYVSVACFLNAVAAPSLNLLRRNLDFKKIQIFQVLSYALGYIGIGIPLALAGYGVFALVFAWITQSALLTLFAFASVRHRVKPLLWYAEAGFQSIYGLAVFATNITNWLMMNIDES